MRESWAGPTRLRGQLGPAFPKGRQFRGSTNLDATFSALSDPTRRAMLERLSQGELSVTELARPFRISLPAVSKHLRVLEEAGLLTREKEGRVHRLRLDATPLMSTAAWIAHYRSLWENQLEALGGYLEGGKKGKRSQ